LLLFYQLMRVIGTLNGRRLICARVSERRRCEVAASWPPDSYAPNSSEPPRISNGLRRMSDRLPRADHMCSMRSIVGGILGVVESSPMSFLDGDLVTPTSRGRGGIRAATIFSQLGHPVPQPDPARIKGKHNYVARHRQHRHRRGSTRSVEYNIMNEPNQHFESTGPGKIHSPRQPRRCRLARRHRHRPRSPVRSTP